MNLNKINYILLFIFFLGCGENLNNNTISIWHQMLYENRKILREVCDKYEIEHPGINIQLIYKETEELRSSFQASAMGGSGPELIYYPSDQVGTFVTMGLIKPLNIIR